MDALIPPPRACPLNAPCEPLLGNRLACCLLLLTATLVASADEVRLVPIGTEWRWLPGTSAPAAGWAQPGFDDVGWVAGRSGFSNAGGEVSNVGGGAQTWFFRREFTLTNAAAVKWLVLRVDYLGGFVARLNGTEIARVGLPSGALELNALATPHARGATEELDLSAYSPLLVSGTNALTLEAHTGSDNPSALVLVPELLGNFPRGPLVQALTTNAVTLLWRTARPADSSVDYGLTTNLECSVTFASPTNDHRIRLENLPAGSVIHYRIRSQADGVEAVSPVFAFHTLKATGPLQFAVLGDSGSGTLPQMRVADGLAGAPADLVMHLGDHVYPQFTYGWADTRLLSVYGEKLRAVPLFPVFGNHDLYSGSDQPLLTTFAPPTNSATGTSHYYSFDAGDAHFTVLFAPLMQVIGDTADYMPGTGSAQWNWLTNDLAASTKPWKLIFLHLPVFTSSAHRADDYNYNGEADRLELQRWLLPLAAEQGVRAIFSGHEHCYERFAPTHGVHCFISGGGGYSLYGMSTLDAQSAFFRSAFHHLRVAITNRTMTVLAVDLEGVVFDSSTITLPPPAFDLRITLLGDHTVRLRWRTTPGKTYLVAAAPEADGPFTDLVEATLPRLATGAEETLDLAVTGAARRFLRVSERAD